MATQTTTKTTAAESKGTATTEISVNSIEKIVEDHTPAFVSKTISSTIDTLESFRINHFNSPYIFYPILFILVFYVLRYLWRRFL